MDEAVGPVLGRPVITAGGQGRLPFVGAAHMEDGGCHGFRSKRQKDGPHPNPKDGQLPAQPCAQPGHSRTADLSAKGYVGCQTIKLYVCTVEEFKALSQYLIIQGRVLATITDPPTQYQE